ncbi:MAG: glycosyltransferase family 39 protein [Parcubacteria group bacterium]
MTKTTKIAGLVITIATTLAVFSFWNDSLIVDEIPHIGAGYSYLKKGDMRLNSEHPPLAKDIGALPLVIFNSDELFESEAWNGDGYYRQWNFGASLLYPQDTNSQALTRAVKFPMLIFFILSAVLIFKWCLRRYGDKTALLALTLFAFSPTILAHSRYVATDVPAMFGCLLAMYFFIKFLKDTKKQNLIIASIAIGIALLTKFSTILLIPLFLVIAFIWGIVHTHSTGRQIEFGFKYLRRTIIMIAIGFVIIVWPVYFLHTMNYPAQQQQADTQRALNYHDQNAITKSINWMSDKPILRSAGHYAFGAYLASKRITSSSSIYFMGELTDESPNSYFPIVYFLKEPLAWWGLVLLALSATVIWIAKRRQNIKRINQWIRDHIDEFTMIIFLLMYWAVSIRGGLNIGIRHLLPTYPFAIILVSGVIGILLKDKLRQRVVDIVVTILIAWYVAESLLVFPHYLTYFNQVAGGPSGGYKYVADSNIDWGQDLKRLGDWIKANNIKKIEVDYFGWASTRYYIGDAYIWTNSERNPDAQTFIQNNSSDGWLAVSVQNLQTTQSKTIPGERAYKWLDEYEPIAKIGNSIFVYNIRE